MRLLPLFPRSLHVLVLVLATLSACSLASRLALAQDAPPSQPTATTPNPPAPAPAPEGGDVEKRKQQAKERFLKGLEFVQNESWDAALAEFLASRELYPTKVALKNAAISLRQLKRYSEALDMYRELAREFGSSLTPEEKKNVDDAIAALQASVGEVVVESDQRESTVIIDGQQRGTTPLAQPIVVNAGTHTVRVVKEGFETFEAQLLVAGSQKKAVKATLKALNRVGTLSVREADGKVLDVVVDGAVVGKTPWQGLLAVGTHTVFLRGAEDVGTPPSAATVVQNQTSTLTLRAAKLDAGIRIEPTPSNARVFVDGVNVGNGVWEGRLKSGPHKVEVAADGFIPDRRDVSVRSGQRELLKIALDRDLNNPMWLAGFVPHIYVEVVGGLGLATSFGGSADAACSRGECSNESNALGFLAGARGGYQISPVLGADLLLGYLLLSESMTRKIRANVEGSDFTSNDYEDKTKLAGPIAAVGVTARFLDKTPVTLRVWAGAGRFLASFENSGTFTGTTPNRQPILGTTNYETISVTQRMSVPEKNERIWVPLVAPEARIGYRFSKKLSADVGVALLLMFAPDTPRTGSGGLSTGEGDREALISRANAFTNPPGDLSRVFKLPSETGFATFYVILPTVAGRFDF